MVIDPFVYDFIRINVIACVSIVGTLPMAMPTPMAPCQWPDANENVNAHVPIPIAHANGHWPHANGPATNTQWSISMAQFNASAN